MPRTAPNVAVKASQLSRLGGACRCRGSSSSGNTARRALASADVKPIEEQYRRVSAALDRPGPGGLGDQDLVCAVRRGVRADPMAGEATVVVAAAGGGPAGIPGECEQAGLLGFRLVGVEDLQPGQARSGQDGDLGVVDEQGAVRPGVGQDGDASGRAAQGYRASRV